MNFLSQPVKKAVLRLFEDLATPRSLAVKLLVENGEWGQLVNLKVDPSNYLNAFDYWKDVSATSLFRKCQGLPTGIDLEQTARDQFFKCEEICFRTNVRLYPLFDGASASPYSEDVHLILERARKIISDILGPCPTLLSGRFGPGSTFGDKGTLSTIPDKMSSSPTFTHDAWPFLFQWSGTLWAKALASSCKVPVTVPGNRFVSVPKDATKNRGIAIEPSLNVFYQLAYGRLIRDRLRRRGIHLDEGQEIHRRLAREASNDGSLSTLDLSNASDTICRNLVKLLLPPSWFEWLDRLRSKKTLVDNKWYLLEKFSSMGNGFTFELETLIFGALVSSLVGDGSLGKTVFAYGDDLIFPSERSNDVISMLSFFGFTTNKDKSFFHGDFRESCGGDYFRGEDVRPFFLKSLPTEPQHLIAFANGLRRSGSNHIGRDYLLSRARLAILDGLPVAIRSCRGPEDLGDIVIHDDQGFWRTRWKSGCRYIRCYRPASFRKIGWWGFSDDVLLATSVYGLPVSRGDLIPRDGVTGYKLSWSVYS